MMHCLFLGGRKTMKRSILKNSLRLRVLLDPGPTGLTAVHDALLSWGGTSPALLPARAGRPKTPAVLAILVAQPPYSDSVLILFCWK